MGQIKAVTHVTETSIWGLSVWQLHTGAAQGSRALQQTGGSLDVTAPLTTTPPCLVVDSIPSDAGPRPR